MLKTARTIKALTIEIIHRGGQSHIQEIHSKTIPLQNNWILISTDQQILKRKCRPLK